MNILDNLDTFIELIPDLAFFKNVNGEYTHCNSAFLNFIKKNREDIINRTSSELYSTTNATQFNGSDEQTLANNKSTSYQEVFVNEDGSLTYFDTRKQIIYDEKKNQLGLFCIVKDITLRKQFELIYEDTQLILEYIAKNDDFIKNLNKIVLLEEKRNSDSKCSIVLLSESKQNLLKGSAPSLPDFYNDAINGLQIGEKVGSCGSAAYKRQRVIVEDINKHENWQPYLALSQKANLHSCWSEPIISSKDELLGCFAIYNHKPKAPTDFELKLIHSYAHLASVAIEKENNYRRLQEQECQILEHTKKVNEQLKKSEYELSQIFDNALVGLMHIDKNRVLLKGNQYLADILGYANAQEMVGISMRNIHLSEERYLEFGQTYFQTLTHEENLNVEYQLKRKDGSSVWCEISGKVLDRETPADLLEGVLWTLKDISQRIELQESLQERAKEIENKNQRLKDLAAKDHLTGLFNRSKLDEVLEYQLKHSKRYGTVFGVIMIDIDYFKVVNDTYGHQAGDAVLCEFAALLKSFFRESDTVGRWGGEEFLVIVSNTDKDDVINLAEKLRATIEKHNFPIITNKTASLGIAVYHPDEKANELINRADKALYEAKNSGRNKVKFL